MGFPGGSDGKESACSGGDPGWEDPLKKGMATPLQYSYLEDPHGQRSLESYSPRGHREPDTTE